jgi:hypothetical protein
MAETGGERIYLMSKIIVCGVVMIFIGGACFVADCIGTWKRGNAVLINGHAYYMVKSRHCIGDDVEMDGNEYRIIGIEKTNGELRYTIVGNCEGMSVVANECK